MFNKKYYLIIPAIVIIISIILVYVHMDYRHHKYVNINNLVNQAYTSSKGYDADIAKHMARDVYNNSNGYILYKNIESKKPLRISLKLTEVNQHKINEKVYVYMLYDFYVRDANGKVVSASLQSPVVFTVTENNNNLYIEHAQEYIEGVNQVPKIYK